jgi:hypothetical protein
MNKIVIFIFIVAVACQASSQYIHDFSNEISYSYRVIQYADSINNENIISYKYFNEKDQLIEEVEHEFRKKFKYDSEGKLTETFLCRMYNCKIGIRELIVYDEFDNIIGTQIKNDTSLIIDTTNFFQRKFYNKKNLLDKEISDVGTYSNGEKYYYWKYYVYDDTLLIEDIEKRNNDTIWVREYHYDSSGKLFSIIKKNNNDFENIYFEYNNDNLLTKKTIVSNKYPITENTSYHAHNNSTVYKYDLQKRLVEEKILNHKGETYRTFFFIYDK